MKHSLLFALMIVLVMMNSCKHPTTNEQLSTADKTANIPQGLILENENTKAIFSKQTGVLLYLENKKTGWRVQNRPELALSFNLLVPMKDKRTNYVYGKKQKLASYQVSEDNKTISFFWNKLQSEYSGELDIRLKGMVTISDAGLNFNMDIDNQSNLIVEAVSYPVIGDMPQPSRDEKLVSQRLGYAGLWTNYLLPEFNNFKGYFGVDYPTQSHNTPDAPFVLTATDKQGLYVGCHDTANKEMVSFTFELKPGYGIAHSEGWGRIITDPKASKEIPRLEMNIWHFSFVNPAEKYSLSDIFLSTYNGTWHKGVDKYKEWRKTWYQAPPTPAWVKEVHSWQQIQINCSEDNLLFQYKDLVKYAQQCARHGVKAIQLTGWNNGGQDRNNPSHDTDPRLGTWQEFKESIAQCEKMGVHIILFNKYTWADRSTERFRNDLIRWAAKDMFGDFYVFGGYQYHTPTQLNDISTRRLIPMCMLSQQWRDVADMEFKKGIELGASGMLFDECQHHGGANYCFDKTHRHHIPAFIYHGDALLDRGFRAITAKMKPDYLFAGEACYDLEYRYYNVSYFRLDAYSQHLPAQRYIDSDKGIMMAVEGFQDRMQCNTALRFKYIISYEPYNFKGQLEDFPLTIAYGEKIDSLRNKYKEYIWDGEFRDTQEATVTKDGQPYAFYSVFKTSTGKYAVVIVNNDEVKSAEVSLELENKKSTLVYVSPDNMQEKNFQGKINIPAISAVVIIEK